ncbi:NADP-dependent malic enzyme [Lysobacter capsici]|jgi:malate dehydrogenase (oxaloacetate-decarboxylating)(NADP+)|uniref:NADP-dependent malic enzyme n=1 Tax=Lysobacter capsici TaxID=435897 RepID=UPI000627E358|nr:NADP-dependent malic enzyme [Lysobacter capsici]ALN83902.1 malic enzyme, NAD binding domain protein [Lysobacter capsici]ATE70343.1 NADP-dependent malic enzyme [Lysobacter capsici]UOF15572.1 NADP-dependent malic enzyme [Lysobacter capsici]WND81294.1 NADP-dependent malic enzyme [Lysobacter capsici]WND86490.1 NADP-dependent malic enzyme [Lysobacter capsici]
MSDNDLKTAALDYHRLSPPGKIKVTATKPMVTQRDLALAYSPGVAYACEAIVADPNAASELTARGNLVAVISNGTAVLGLGDIGPLAGKPVMEGKGVLFQKFAGIDVFDIEIDERDPDKLVDIIASLEPTFGGINLEDIKAPECFIVERKLRERMKIPVFHDDQHGTAIIVGSAVLNALEVVGKKIEDVKLATSGAGAAGIACLDMLVALGMKPENILAVDRDGVLYTGRGNMDPDKQRYARDTDKRSLADIIAGADVFLGLSAGGVLKPEMVATMADKPIILALANPYPEILPEDAKAVRPDCIIATGRSDYPNQVNNALCFPYIFRGALDVGATVINEEMKLACVRAIAALARMESSDLGSAYGGDVPTFGSEYLIPRPFDPRLLVMLAPAVAKAAMDSGVATRPIADMDAYEEKLSQYIYRTGLLMKPVYDRARSDRKRVVYAEGEEETVLRAVQTVIDEELAYPILIGRPDVIETRIQRLGLRMREGVDFELTNINDDPRFNEYWQQYHALTERRGVSPAAAKNLLRSRPTLIAALMVERGEADAMISGLVGRFHKKLGYMRSIFDFDPGVSGTSAMTGVINDQGAWFFLDTHVQVDPTAEQIAEATLQATYRLKLFGIEPKVALLSHSNYGSHDNPSAAKMRKVRQIVKQRQPKLEIDGEMQADTAWDDALRQRIFPNATLHGRANLFVLPNLDAANITYNMVRVMTDGVAIGPILMGLDKPAHILTPASTPRRVVNMTAIAAVDAQIRASRESERKGLSELGGV